MHEVAHVRRGVWTETEGVRQGVEDLFGRLFASLFDAVVIVGADAGQDRHFFAP